MSSILLNYETFYQKYSFLILYSSIIRLLYPTLALKCFLSQIQKGNTTYKESIFSILLVMKEYCIDENNI